MTANQSTVKSDMATVDYGSFQPTKPHCLLSNCLSFPKKRNTSEVEFFFFACANKLSAVIKCAQSPYALMARLGHSLRKRRLFPEVLRLKIQFILHLDAVNYHGFKFGKIGSESLQQPTHPTGAHQPL